MKQIMISVELGLAQDIIKIIGAAIHNRFSHDEVGFVKDLLKSKIDESIQNSAAEVKSAA